MTKKPPMLDARSIHMLELLSQGASARVIAKKLGYSEGTMRVYLHNLYRAIGVRNKTEAVIWHLGRRAEAPAALAASAPPVAVEVPGDLLGSMALSEDLHTALGVMGEFLGPYGQVWEAGLRLKGTAFDEQLVARRAQARLLWRALLKGDFAYGKTLSDTGAAERLAAEAPADAVLLATLLTIGGYSAAADRLVARLAQKRKSWAPISAREGQLLQALRAAANEPGEAGLAPLASLAGDGSRAPVLKHIACAALFHLHRVKRNIEGARMAARALWFEAEGARAQLEAMGLRPLGREDGATNAKGATREVAPSRERAMVAR